MISGCCASQAGVMRRGACQRAGTKAIIRWRRQGVSARPGIAGCGSAMMARSSVPASTPATEYSEPMKLGVSTMSG
jgi:hypothetical protein